MPAAATLAPVPPAPAPEPPASPAALAGDPGAGVAVPVASDAPAGDPAAGVAVPVASDAPAGDPAAGVAVPVAPARPTPRRAPARRAVTRGSFVGRQMAITLIALATVSAGSFAVARWTRTDTPLAPAPAVVTPTQRSPALAVPGLGRAADLPSLRRSPAPTASPAPAPPFTAK